MIKVIQPKAVGVINYKGFSLVPSQVGKGWRVNIYDPGSTASRPDSPCVLEPCAEADVLKDARKIVDEVLDSAGPSAGTKAFPGVV